MTALFEAFISGDFFFAFALVARFFSFKMSLFLPKDVGNLFHLLRKMSAFDSETPASPLGGQTSILLQSLRLVTLSLYSVLGDE